MSFDEKLSKVLLEFDMIAPEADPQAYSRILMMLAEIRQQWLQAKTQDEKNALGRKACGIVDNAIKTNILDQDKAIDWLYSSMPGIEVKFADELPNG